MGGLADKTLGSLMLIASGIVFTYYTTWTLVLPFFPQDHPIHSLFLSREWAIRIPALVLVVGLSAVGYFIAQVLRAERRKAERKRLAKAA